MSIGFKVDEGDVVAVVVYGTPDTVQYEMGLKNPYNIMRYVQGKGRISHDFKINKSGRHYFYVTNMRNVDLDIEAAIIY